MDTYFQMIIDITGACGFNEQCVGLPDNIIICKNVQYT